MPEPSNIATLVPMKTDADLAAAFRAELAPLMDQVCDILNRARKEGLILNFNVAPDQFGRVRVAEVSVVRPL